MAKKIKGVTKLYLSEYNTDYWNATTVKARQDILAKEFQIQTRKSPNYIGRSNSKNNACESSGASGSKNKKMAKSAKRYKAVGMFSGLLFTVAAIGAHIASASMHLSDTCQANLSYWEDIKGVQAEIKSTSSRLEEVEQQIRVRKMAIDEEKNSYFYE